MEYEKQINQQESEGEIEGVLKDNVLISDFEEPLIIPQSEVMSYKLYPDREKSKV